MKQFYYILQQYNVILYIVICNGFFYHLIIFYKYFLFSCNAELRVTGAQGGLWKYPLRLVATEAPVDDTIMIEATGLTKVSAVGFKLNSNLG